MQIWGPGSALPLHHRPYLILIFGLGHWPAFGFPSPTPTRIPIVPLFSPSPHPQSPRLGLKKKVLTFFLLFWSFKLSYLHFTIFFFRFIFRIFCRTALLSVELLCCRAWLGRRRHKYEILFL